MDNKEPPTSGSVNLEQSPPFRKMQSVKRIRFDRFGFVPVRTLDTRSSRQRTFRRGLVGAFPLPPMRWATERPYLFVAQRVAAPFTFSIHWLPPREPLLTIHLYLYSSCCVGANNSLIVGGTVSNVLLVSFYVWRVFFLCFSGNTRDFSV